MGFLGKLFGKGGSAVRRPEADRDEIQRWFLEHLKLKELSVETKNKLLQSILRGILSACTQAASEKLQKRLDVYLEQNGANPENMFNFYRENLPGFSEIATREISQFKEIYDMLMKE